MSDQIKNVIVHRKPACRIELEVKASPSLVAAARKEAIKTINKEVSFPGFRKGRAPDEMILKKYPGAVEKEWHKAIADAAFAAAQSQERFSILQTGSSVTFDLKSHSLEEGAEILFSFETDPVVPSVDPKGFQLSPIKTQTVGENEIEEAIRQILFFHAEWKPVVDRGIQEGDTILIDLDTIEGEETQKVFHRVRFEVSEARMANWMKQLVIGAKAGDVLSGMSEADETASEEEKREFRPKQIRLTIHKAEVAILPELSDEFAYKLGASTVAQMRESIRSILENNIKDHVRTKSREQVNDFLIAQYQFELPLSLIETEKKHRKTQFLDKSKESYEQMSSEEKKQLEEKLYTEASQAVRLFYLSRQIVRDAKIPVTHSEVQQEAVQSAHVFGRNIDPDHLPKEVFALALSKVILLKAQDYILEQNSVADLTSTSAPAIETT